MGAPIVVQPRQNFWQGMLMQMYMTKFAHNLKVKQDTLDLDKAKVMLEEKRIHEAGVAAKKGTATAVTGGWKPSEKGTEGAVRRPGLEVDGGNEVWMTPPPKKPTTVKTKNGIFELVEKDGRLTVGDKLGEEKRTISPAGFEMETKRLVVKDTEGNLLYQDTKQPYKGGQLKPITESAMASMMGTGGFNVMPYDLKEYWYQQYAADKSALPPFYYRDPASKNDFIKGFAEYQKRQNVTGGSATAKRETIKSFATSLKTQQKNRGMMGSFVGNINKQIGEIERISKDLVERFGVRALDVPRRELVTRAIGSGQENVLKAYLKEVSTEIAKLSQGSAASVQQLPEENRKEWDRIHDVNLSFKELSKVLHATRDMANMRLSSVDEELSRTIDAMEGVTGKQPKVSKKVPKIGTIKGGYLFNGGNPADPKSWKKVNK